jgi:hypothetical protein
VHGLLKCERELMGGAWFVKMGNGTSGRCVVCMGDGVETRYVVVLDQING